MRSALLCNITQPRVGIPHRRYWTTYRSLLHRSASQKERTQQDWCW